MDIVPIVKRNSGCDYHRIVLPLKVMGIDTEDVADQKLEDLITGAKIVIINRYIDNFMELLEMRQKYGFKLIVDLDDYWELYPKHDLYKFFNETSQPFKIKLALANADAVTTTTERLAEMIRPINSNVYVIPNAIPFNFGQFTEAQNREGNLKIVYAGGSSHYWDIKQVETLFHKIKNSNLDKRLELHLCGYERSEGHKNVWGKMVDMFTAKGRINNFHLHDSLPLTRYMNHYDNGNLALAPLEGNNFNSFKSNLKVLEAGCKKIPIIVSDVLPYSLELDEYVIKANTSTDWFNKIKYCIENPEYVKDKGEALYEYVRERYNMQDANNLRKELFNKLTNQI